ncbi:MAG: hypothetical protein ABJM58_04885 [Alteripontixanthobacter sp.]
MTLQKSLRHFASGQGKRQNTKSTFPTDWFSKMPKRTNNSSIFVIGAVLSLSACEGAGAGGTPLTSIDDCMERLREPVRVLGDPLVTGSFVYNIDSLEAAVELGKTPDTAGPRMTLLQGGGQQAVIDEFKNSPAEASPTALLAEGIGFVKIGFGPAPAQQVAELGCGKITPEISVEHYSMQNAEMDRDQ